MNNPENLGREEQPASPEEFITRDIADGLRKIRQLKQLVVRGEKTQADLDTLKDNLRAQLDEGIGNMEWFGEKDEFGDLGQERFR
jgi:hypothetical protein